MQKPYVIAEAGVNFYDTAAAMHITPLDAAKLYIAEAAKAGVDAVKFQAYKAKTIVSKNSPAYWDLTKEPTPTQYGLFCLHDSFNSGDYAALAVCCKENGVDFLCTPFDDASVDFLDPLCSIYKVSSSDLTNEPFLRHVAGKKKPVYLSVGASYLYEVDRAVQVLQEGGCPEIALMHCILSYPTRHEDANLAQIETLRRVYPDLKIGYSDHTVPDPTMTVVTAAYLMGAQVLEKHFTLDKTLPGNDHYHAGDPGDFKMLLQNLNLVQTLTGSGEKTVLPCEETSRKQARRSLVLTRDMRKGERITEADIMAKRPGTGISPAQQAVVLGRAVREDLPEDTVLTWDML